MTEQLRLDIEAPRAWTLSPAYVWAGKVWLPRCREALEKSLALSETRE